MNRDALVSGDPAYDRIERSLAAQPEIEVPATSLVGLDDGIRPGPPRSHAEKFGESYVERPISGVGHNLPQEAPEAFAAATRERV